MWRGDAASDASKRARARRRYSADRECERCGKPGPNQRHHVDGNPGNNDRANISILCNRCHMEIDGRLAALPTLGLAAAQAQAERTHCPRGHEYSEENTYRHRGKRYCRACNRESHRSRSAAA